jgi:hypothetical protein
MASTESTPHRATSDPFPRCGTPIDTTGPNIDRFFRTPEHRADLFKRLAREISGHLVCDMNPKVFLDTFLPRKKRGKSTNRRFKNFQREMKESLLNLINKNENLWYVPFVSSHVYRPRVSSI